MTEAVRELMFTPFYTTKGRDKGTGLGPYISFGIIEEHHGKLNVESVDGEYTIMNIELPVSQPFDDWFIYWMANSIVLSDIIW